MNIFRLIGDLSHLGAILFLLFMIYKRKSCAGISGKSQVLYLLVFVTRYLDLFTNFVSYYNSIMKVFFIISTTLTVSLVYFFKFKKKPASYRDKFRVEFLLIPAGILAFVVNHEYSVMEIFWTFSIYLEAVAILPQLFMGSNTTYICLYLFALGSYRGFYIFNWIYRYHFEGFYDVIAISAGVVQTLVYLAFWLVKIYKGSRCLGFREIVDGIKEDFKGPEDDGGEKYANFEPAVKPKTLFEKEIQHVKTQKHLNELMFHQGTFTKPMYEVLGEPTIHTSGKSWDK